MKSLLYLLLPASLMLGLNGYAADNFRPPAVPLVVHDPYFSIWSPADKLTDAETVHWTGAKHPLHLIVRIDGKPYRLMGTEPVDVPALEQKSVTVRSLTTTYRFENDNIEAYVEFFAPLVPSHFDQLSRPATYLTCNVRSKDGTNRNVEFYLDAGAEIAVNMPEQTVLPPVAFDFTANKMTIKSLKVGTDTQNVLERKGDNVRIDWGHFILSADGEVSARQGKTAREEFAATGILKTPLPKQDKYAVKDSGLVLTSLWKVEQKLGNADVFSVLAYDDEYSIRYFKNDLRAWWKRDGKTTEKMLEDAWNDWAKSRMTAYHFDEELENSLTAVSGSDYAKLCALAYRQVFGANKLVAGKDGVPLMFSKENFSNGCIATVDMMYPMSPFFLYYSPELMRATLEPEFQYAESERWKFPFAPHDIGTYPHATGQVYGGGEKTEDRQMPVEESANMIIVCAALAKREGNADYAKKHWKTLTKWAEYLAEKGFDPENQLCTDDFAGHLAHNVNLSAKAIIALGGYAQLADTLGKKEITVKYRKLAGDFAKHWVTEAADGDHTKLAFDKPGTWSMKYNLMWDEILDLKLFPREVIDREIAFYKTKMYKYGLPLDSRQNYTKIDWELWTAALTNNRADFEVFLKPVIGFINNTDSRVPINDWYVTENAKMKNMLARGVVGGFWSPMLKNAEQWRKQAGQGAK
ncbi:MAG: DUF4965 domain-containing protein [Planctomycetaceae bacterium]|nr:DUF4965 domain-containing protein [Planctomycetaceae bacterium]